jgi:hypothetical protein
MLPFFAKVDSTLSTNAREPCTRKSRLQNSSFNPFFQISLLIRAEAIISNPLLSQALRINNRVVDFESPNSLTLADQLKFKINGTKFLKFFRRPLPTTQHQTPSHSTHAPIFQIFGRKSECLQPIKRTGIGTSPISESKNLRTPIWPRQKILLAASSGFQIFSRKSENYSGLCPQDGKHQQPGQFINGRKGNRMIKETLRSLGCFGDNCALHECQATQYDAEATSCLTRKVHDTMSGIRPAIDHFNDYRLTGARIFYENLSAKGQAAVGTC